jgi:hypothetical protein
MIVDSLHAVSQLVFTKRAKNTAEGIG